MWSVSGSTNGLIATTSSDRSIRVLDASGHIVRVLRGHGHDVSGVAFAPDGKWLVSSSIDGTVRRWQLGSDSPPDKLKDLALWLDEHTSAKPAD